MNNELQSSFIGIQTSEMAYKYENTIKQIEILTERNQLSNIQRWHFILR